MANGKDGEPIFVQDEAVEPNEPERIHLKSINKEVLPANVFPLLRRRYAKNLEEVAAICDPDSPPQRNLQRQLEDYAKIARTGNSKYFLDRHGKEWLNALKRAQTLLNKEADDLDKLEQKVNRKIFKARFGEGISAQANDNAVTADDGLKFAKAVAEDVRTHTNND